MITGKKEELDQVVETHRCPEHDNPLVVAWHGGESSYVIRCGAGHFPEEVTRIKTRTEQYKADQLENVDPEFSLLLTKDLETGLELSPSQLKGLISYARGYGLDPYRGHVVLMFGQPYITLDGYIWHADRRKVPYQLLSRPLTTQERADYQVEEGAYAWLAFLNINYGEKLFNGIGVVTKQEMTEMSRKKPDHLRYPIVAAKPWQMAQKRAEWQVMKRGFPIGESEEIPSET